MYANGVVGVSGLAGDRDAIALAQALAPANARLALVHVRLMDTVPTRGSNGALTSAETELSYQLLERQRQAYDEKAEVISVAALSVGAGLHQAAEDRGADVIVVGGCHRGPVGRVMVGDDALSTLHHAPCAVAVAPAGSADRSAPMGTIGLAYDASEQSEVGLAHARLLAADLGAKLRIRQVVEVHVYGAAGWAPSAAIVEDPDALVEAARERIGLVPGADIEVVVGPVFTELAALSTEVDVLVCGSRQQGAAKRVLLGSTSDYLARHAHCPLIVTPASDPERIAEWHELRDVATV
jgi:nucleotide-binding universal stress UspA family protein